jgi:general secretion pathway protein G
MNACFFNPFWHTGTLGCEPSGPHSRIRPMTAIPVRRKTRGFSLLELLVAMMIIAVLGTLGFSQFRKHSAQARYLKAQDDLKIVSEGLDQFYLKHGSFPDFGSFDAMVDNNSSLVKESLIKVGMSAQDPFGQPYEGKSTKANYELKCAGDPNNQEDAGPIVRTPGQVTSSSPVSGPSTATPKGDAPAVPGAKK